jgi:peptidoglycan/xylan/chitin deacetylase (PgdA/CDA1 family)
VQPLRLEEIEKIMTELCAKHSRSSDGQAHRLMTRDEVRTIRSDNIEFGSHALTHASLPSLTAAEKAREIKDSVHACLELTGARPVSFAYPFGDYDEECQRLVGEAGYECACTIEESSVRPDSGLFALPRVQVGNWTARELAKTLHAL